MKRTLSHILALVLAMATLATTASAAPLTSPCGPGATYDPACDVNHDNIVDVLDIQLTAGHWNQTGTWTAGDSWALTGNAGTSPASNFVGTTDGQDLIVQPGAGRVGIGTTVPTTGKLHVAGGGDTGVYATSTNTFGMFGVSLSGNGVKGASTDSAGIYGVSTNGSGVYGASTNSNGVYGQTVTAFQPGVKGVNGASSGIGVRGEANASGGVGVWGQSNANTGVYGLSTDGIGVWGQSTNGVAIRAESTNNYGVYVASAGISGVVVISANSNGLTVSSAGGNGVGVSSAGANGVVVSSAGNTGVNANTIQASGQWGFYTDDAIHGSNVLIQSISLVGQVAGPDSLTAGEIVAVAGVADPVAGSTVHLPLVRLANGSDNGIVGVVEGRLVLTQQPSQKPPAAGDVEAETPLVELRSADGPAQAGDYVAIIVLGAAQVKVDPAVPIGAGQRLTIAEVGGHARPLRTVRVEGVEVDESGPTLGVTMEPAQGGLVWVMINPQ